MIQLIINILLSGLIYLLIALSFTQIFITSKFFHLTHAAIITLAAYFTFFFSKQLEINLFFTIPLALIMTTLIGILIEIFIYKPLRKQNATSLLLLIASLGLYLIIQNIISLIWGDDTTIVRTGNVKVGYKVLNAYITDIQIITIVITIFLFGTITTFLKYSKIGRSIRAVSGNIELSNVLGINTNAVILWSFCIGSLLAASVGILVAFDTDMTPTMGFNLLLYGIVAMIIGGVGSTWGLVGGAFLLATAQHLGAYYIDSKWMDAIAYIILILFLIWKPLGFSGKRLKKIEI